MRGSLESTVMTLARNYGGLDHKVSVKVLRVGNILDIWGVRERRVLGASRVLDPSNWEDAVAINDTAKSADEAGRGGTLGILFGICWVFGISLRCSSGKFGG